MKNLRNITCITLIALCTTLFTTNVNAQSFEKGDFDLNATIGFGNAWYYGTYYHMGLPFIAVAADYGLKEDWGPGVFGIGGVIGISTVKTKYSYIGADYGYKYTNFSIVPRATYHYQFVDKLDTYAGVATGITIRSGKEYGDYPLGAPDDSGVRFVITAFVGAKYYLTDNLAVMSEIYVYDLAIFNIGVGFKF